MECSVFGRLVMLLCAVCLAWPTAAEAAQRVVAEDFSIELPEWWMQVVPAPPGSVLAVHSRKKERTLSVSAASVDPAQTEQGRSEFVASSKKWLTDHGYVVESEKAEQQNGVAWATIAARAGSGTTQFWIGGNEGRIYSLRAWYDGGEVTKDNEVQETLRSFQRVAPTAALAPERTRLVLQGPVNFARISTPLIVLLVASALGIAVLLVFDRARQEKG